MDKLEQLLKVILSRAADKTPRKKQGKCLSEEEMAVLIDNKCSPNEEEKYSQHILSCHTCYDLLKDYILTAKSIEQEGEVEAPSWLVAKVKDLVPGESNKGSVLDLVLELRDKVLELIETTGESFMPALPAYALRDKARKTPSDGEKNEPNTIHVIKTFGKFAVDVEIDKRICDTSDLVLRLTDKETNKKAEGVRVSLYQKGREIESVMLEGGKVKFEDIVPESYQIVILKEGMEIGKINVSIKSKKQD